MSELEGEIDSGHVGGYRYGTALTNKISSLLHLVQL